MLRAAAIVASAAAVLAGAQAVGRTIPISYDEARAAIAAHSDSLPVPLSGKTGAALEAAWPAWVAQHNAEIRSRLQRGDEDSLVNFWLYGTSFTKLPRATDRELATLADRDKAAELLESRLDDLVTAVGETGRQRSTAVRAIGDRATRDQSGDGRGPGQGPRVSDRDSFPSRR